MDYKTPINYRRNLFFSSPAVGLFVCACIQALLGDITLLKDESEVALIRLLAGFPRQIELAAMVNEPHRIAYYLYDLASAFHALWNKGRDDVQMRFLDENNVELSKARLALIQAVCFVIASGLSVFGVQPVKEM